MSAKLYKREFADMTFDERVAVIEMHRERTKDSCDKDYRSFVNHAGDFKRRVKYHVRQIMKLRGGLN